MPKPKLIVTRCSTCPFFEENALKKLGGVIIAALMSDSQTGICNLLPSDEFYPSADLKLGLPPGPERVAEESRMVKARTRRVIHDKRTIPSDCPLRQGDRTITITGDN
jgi:hypothetical protein